MPDHKPFLQAWPTPWQSAGPALRVGGGALALSAVQQGSRAGGGAAAAAVDGWIGGAAAGECGAGAGTPVTAGQ